nr:alpha-amylase family glycosyl hydrolase [Conyzicola lurida]
MGFVGAPIHVEQRDGAVAHRLGAMEPWLDHIVELGLNGLILGPVFASTSHGYDTLDHFAIDDRLGDESDLVHLVDTAREKGVRVLLDGVFNHVGRQHPWFLDVEANGPDSPHAGLFRIDWQGWTPGDPVKSDVFEGHDILVALDHESAQVEDLVVDVMTYWLDRGIDGWRLDAAYSVPPAFWARVLPRVRERHPDAWFTGEVIHGADVDFVARSTIDSLTQYELWQGIWHGIADGNLFELGHAIGRHNTLLAEYVPSTFVGNHDVTRIASAIGADRVGHAVAVLFTVAGVPSVYAGDEFGWEAVKEQRIGGDDAIRPAFPARPPLDAELDEPSAALLHTHRQLIGVRRRHPWLVRAHSDVVDVANGTLIVRTAVGADAVITALNISDAELRVPGTAANELVAGDAALDGDHIVVPAGGWAVVSTERSA